MEYTLEELNIEALHFSKRCETELVEFSLMPCYSTIKEEVSSRSEMKGKREEELALIARIKKGELDGVDERYLVRVKTPREKNQRFATAKDYSMELDTQVTPEMEKRREVRELANRVQQFRKDQKLDFEDKLVVVIDRPMEKEHEALLGRMVRSELRVRGHEAEEQEIGRVEGEYGGEPLGIGLLRKREKGL